MRKFILAVGLYFALANSASAQFVTPAIPTSLPASSITIGTTTISGGGTGRIEYNNAGVLGELTTSGSGTVVCLQTSCAMTTPSLGVATGTSLALGGATIGTDVLALTGTETHNAGTLTTAISGQIFNTTWNNAGVTFPGAIVVNITNTASNNASLLFDVQKSGASQFKVDVLGNTTAGGSINAGANVTANGTGIINWSGRASLSSTSASNISTSGTFTITTIGTGTGDFVCAPVAGGLISQGVTTCVASDKRVKNDLGVVTPEMAVARIMALPLEHRFTYKIGYGASGDHTGWWAQDIKKIWPGIVYKGAKTKLTPDGELSMDRGEMGPDTTTAVKWLVMQIRAQQTQINVLRVSNDNLERKVVKLGRRK